MSIPIIYANTQYVAAKHTFKTISQGTDLSLTSLANIPSCNVMTLVGSNVGIGTTVPRQLLDVQGGNAIISGNVGIGTTAPRQLLDVQGGNAIISGNIGIGTTVPKYALDASGDINFTGILRQNNIPYISSQWITSSTNIYYTSGNIGIGTMAPRQLLDVQGGNAIISGNIGIGTTTPILPFHVVGQSYLSANVGIGTMAPRQLLDVQGGGAIISGNVGIGTTNAIQKLYVNGQIYATDNITAFSDIRYKKNIKKIDNVIDKIKQINGYTFNKQDSDKTYMGVIAQEVQNVFPEIIETQGDTLSVAYGNMVAPIIEVVKELINRIEILESKFI